MNKEIKRNEDSARIFDDRSLAQDYRTLMPLLRPGLQVLDVGCGTGAISKDIAQAVEPTGFVTGIDNTEAFITSGRSTYAHVKNLQLLHADLFSFEPSQPFDLIVSARTLQWLSNPLAALQRMKTWLNPNAMLSVLDYNHTKTLWKPALPKPMQEVYSRFLEWRANAGMNNSLADDLPQLFRDADFKNIEVFNANEVYKKSDVNFASRLAIWSKVAMLPQLLEEGYLTETLRTEAIAGYENWIATTAEEMTLYLVEVRGRN